MARGSSQATNAATQAQQLSGQLESNAAGGYAALMPELQAEAAHPAGYDPATLAKMTTSAEQGAGGTQAGATGQGALLASRTKNPGTAQAAIAQSARTAGEQLSKANLGIQTPNVALKEQQRQSGLRGLENLTGLETGAGITSAGQVAQDVNANTNAEDASWNWAKYVLDPTLKAAGGAAGGYLSRP